MRFKIQAVSGVTPCKLVNNVLKEVIYQSTQGCIPVDWTLSDNRVELFVK